MENPTLGNKKDVAYFVYEIKQAVSESTKSWLKIANALSEASDMYGKVSDSYRKICKETKFSESKASKLCSIASSDRLKAYSEKLSAVQSWGTLYAIAALNDSDFEKIKIKLKLDDKDAPMAFVTQSEVESIKKPKRKITSLKSYALIKVDDDAVKSLLLDGEHYGKMNDLLDQLEALSSYIKVQRTGFDSKEEGVAMKKLDERMRQNARSTYLKVISTKMKANKKKGQSEDEAYISVFGLSKVELKQDVETDWKAAFDREGIEYDEADLYDKAQAEIEKETARFLVKVRSRIGFQPEASEDLKEAA